ncbi:MAG: hypothetical protein R2809_10155 [Flavobacteriales bacterium]
MINERRNWLLLCCWNRYISGGLHIVDVNDPLNPVLAGGFSQDGYTHDAWVGIYNGPDAITGGKNCLVACNEDYVTVIDCTR